MRTLYRAAAVHPGTDVATGPGEGVADAVLVDGDRVAWVGRAAALDADAAERTVHLPGTQLAPAFVDAHAHVTETGLLLRGADLRDARTVTEILDRVAAVAAADGDGPVLGHGWDDTLLAERRPPTAAELQRAAPGRAVYLSRVDVHSAVVSPALVAACGADRLDGYDPDGRVERDAHHAARDHTRAALAPPARRAAQLAALRSAAAVGIATVHEMSAPHLAPDQDLRDLVALAAGSPDGPACSGGPGGPGGGLALPAVVAYYGQLVADVDQARDVVARLGVPLAGLAGDLCVDGSVGSRTAAWHDPYRDADPSSADSTSAAARGHLYLTVEQVRDHVAACTRAGLRAGFHVIGDAAVDTARRGLRRAAEQVGIAAVRSARHRLEHVEGIDAAGARDLADLRVTASVQPAFDARWGGDGGLYADRLGRERALAMNPFATLARAGVALALGSDSPVTPFDPWGAVRACADHHVPGERLDPAAAFAAHTVGGWRAAGSGDAGAGTLAVGAPATFAVWDAGTLAPGRTLPGPEVRPRCVLTVRSGRVLHDAGAGVPSS